jgi:hypothetical protein
MMGYNPPLFAASRITADGIDLVENQVELNRRFPPVIGELEESVAELPVLMERLVDEADFSSLDGEQRKCLLRDIQYLRDELARPAERWRTDVIDTVLAWVENHFDGDASEDLPSLSALREAMAAKRK